jgi:hypothetical protein
MTKAYTLIIAILVTGTWNPFQIPANDSIETRRSLFGTHFFIKGPLNLSPKSILKFADILDTSCNFISLYQFISLFLQILESTVVKLLPFC